MAGLINIREVARRTGLTSRALRFYEARGLISPVRTYRGGRFYGPAELERLNMVLTLKRAGLTLTQIAAMIDSKPFDLGDLIDAQIDLIDRKGAELDQARTLLKSVKALIDRGEAVDVVTFCALIRQGDQVMEKEGWKKVIEAHYSSSELAHWQANPPPADFDPHAYGLKWKELGDRIHAALPLDPASDRAQAFVAEWNAMLEPFMRVATPEMKAGAKRFWEDSDRYREQVDMPFTREVMEFIESAQRCGS